MELNKGLQAKLFFLFMLMGAIPFVIFIAVSIYNTIDEQEEASKQNSALRNAVISEHITAFIQKNQAVLKSLAMSPNVVEFVQNPTDERRAYVEKILLDMDKVFNDTNSSALTGADGWQLLRTDGAKSVNLTKRQHFQEAMKGRSYVSDIITSMSTGEMIIVVECPVCDDSGKPIGMIQRNFDLVALQNFVKGLDENEIFIVIMDRTGRVIANSENVDDVGSRFNIDNSYKFILDRIYNSSGVIHVDVNEEDTIANYSRNIETGWMIITFRPYHFIMDRVYEKVIKASIFVIALFFAGTAIAYFVSIHVTKPITEISKVVDNIVSGKNEAVEPIKVSTNDEFGQMAMALNKLRSERDAFQMESELDKLTELFNKKTTENLCKMKLKNFNENKTPNGFIVFYIIDLDHFKEVNDMLGHQFGDKVLVEFAKGLKKIFRSNDCIGRFGGDEFVVIADSLPNMEVVLRKAEQIKQTAFNLTIEGKTRVVTASIGISLAPHNGRDYDTLFAAADKAVYHVKNSGKNGYYCQLFDEGEA